MGKLLIISGLVIALFGLLVTLLESGSIPRLPGDIVIQRDDFRFYFPLGWCLLLSLFFSLLFWLLGK